MRIEPGCRGRPLFPDSGERWVRPMMIVAAMLFVAMLFYLGSKPFAAGLFASPYDKLAHLAAFGTLTCLLWVGFFSAWPVALIMLVSFIGALDEWHQSFLPGRSADPADLLADVAAAIVSVVVLNFLQRRMSGT